MQNRNLEKNRNRKELGICVAIALSLCGCNEQETQQIPIEVWGQANEAQKILPEEKKNTNDTLNVATYLTKIGETYFLADCYHNQILYHDNLQDEIKDWNVLTDEVHYAHTVAGDGTVLLTDDTENNRILVFEKQQGGYVHTQTIENVGLKPHYVQYDEKREEFLAWSSITGEMYYLKRDKKTN